MNKSGTHQYRLRLSISMKGVLSELAWGHRISFAAEVINRITQEDFQKEYPTSTPHPKLTEGESVLVTIHFPIEIFQELKAKADHYRRSVNAEILNRLYQSQPVFDYEQMAREEGEKYAGKERVKNIEPPDKGLCPQTEDERILLEKYRQLTPDQRTQMQAIGDTFTKPIKRKNSG